MADPARPLTNTGRGLAGGVTDAVGLVLMRTGMQRAGMRGIDIDSASNLVRNAEHE